MILRTPKEIETRRRIKISVWAYAYEIMGVSIVSDAIFDMECLQVNLNIQTSNPIMDVWFLCNFTPDTGMWIHKHPELEKVKKLYERYLLHDN